MKKDKKKHKIEAQDPAIVRSEIQQAPRLDHEQFPALPSQSGNIATTMPPTVMPAPTDPATMPQQTEQLAMVGSNCQVPPPAKDEPMNVTSSSSSNASSPPPTRFTPPVHPWVDYQNQNGQHFIHNHPPPQVRSNSKPFPMEFSPDPYHPSLVYNNYPPSNRPEIKMVPTIILKDKSIIFLKEGERTPKVNNLQFNLEVYQHTTLEQIKATLSIVLQYVSVKCALYQHNAQKALAFPVMTNISPIMLMCQSIDCPHSQKGLENALSEFLCGITLHGSTYFKINNYQPDEDHDENRIIEEQPSNASQKSFQAAAESQRKLNTNQHRPGLQQQRPNFIRSGHHQSNQRSGQQPNIQRNGGQSSQRNGGQPAQRGQQFIRNGGQQLQRVPGQHYQKTAYPQYQSNTQNQNFHEHQQSG